MTDIKSIADEIDRLVEANTLADALLDKLEEPAP